MVEDQSLADPLGPVADEFVARFRQGEHPSVAEYASRHPELANRIREMFPLLVMMENVAVESGSAEAETPEVAAPVADRIGGYRLLTEIGRGGMGVVYEAEQIALGRHVALKILPGPLPKDSQRLERFRLEAKAAAKLHHTNIVPVFEVGDDNGTVFYAMQYIHGQSLDHVLAELVLLQRDQHVDPQSPTQSRDVEGAARPASRLVAHSLLAGFCPTVVPDEPAGGGDHLPRAASLVDTGIHVDDTKDSAVVVLPGQSTHLGLDENRSHFYRSVARVGIQVADALGYAHAEGVLHRDIKPSNLLLDTHSRVWITDFGLAKTQEHTDLTRDGDIVGTIRYMAPERFRGEADPRSDLYSLGLTLYEMVSRQPAFDAPDRLTLIERVTQNRPVRLRTLDNNLPRDLETIIEKTIECDPVRRYQTAAELIADLTRFVQNKPILARRTDMRERCLRWCQRNPVVAALLATVLVLAIGGFAGVLWQWKAAVANADLATQNSQRAEMRRVEAQQNSAAALEANNELQQTLRTLSRINYVAFINLAAHSWEVDGDPQRLREILEECRPNPGAPELRGFEWYRLARIARASQRMLVGPRNPILDVDWSPDASKIACSAVDRRVRVWNATDGRLLADFLPHRTSHVTSVAFSHNSQEIATASSSGEIIVWDASNFKPLREFTGDGKPISAICYGTTDTIATAGGTRQQTGQLCVRDSQTGKIHWQLPNATGGAGKLQFSEQSQRLAYVADKHIVRVVDAKTGDLVQQVTPKTDEIVAIALSSDGRRVAAAHVEVGAEVWDVASGEQRFVLPGHDTVTRAVSFDDTGNVLATAGTTVRTWDLETGRALGKWRGHQHSVADLVYAPDGGRFVTGGLDRQLRVWDAQVATEPTEIVAGSGQVTAIAISHESALLATACYDHTIKVFDLATGVERQSWPAGTRAVERMQFADDGRVLVTATVDHLVQTWAVASGKALQNMPEDHKQLYDLALGPNGRGVAMATIDKKLILYDIREGHFQQSLASDQFGSRLMGLCYSVDGARLLVTPIEGNRQILDSTTAVPHAVWDANPDLKSPHVFSPDGRSVVATTNANQIALLSTSSGKRLQLLAGHTDEVLQAVFTPSGDRLATCGRDGAIKLWDLTTGREVMRVDAGIYIPSCLAFADEGRQLLVGCSDGRVRCWLAMPVADPIVGDFSKESPN